MKNGGAALIILVSTLFQSSAFSESLPVTGEIIIFHAGSLSVPFRDIAAAFEKEYPNVQVLREAAGSRTCARKIADLERPCDIFASADYAVIDSLLIPEHAAWNIKFASNEMVIAYTKDSKAIQEITRDNWHRILLRSDIRFGRSEPNTDPCGYRTLLTLKLAEGFYDLPGLAQSFSKKDQRYIRPKETDLLALLETQSIDYVFIYRSVAEQHKLKWITLPDKINLKRPDFAKHYAAVSVGLSGTAPNTIIKRQGEPMIYGVTIPRNAPNPTGAQAFAKFLLDKKKGLAILEKNGQPGLVPAVSSTFSKIPEALKPFAIQP